MDAFPEAGILRIAPALPEWAAPAEREQRHAEQHEDEDGDPDRPERALLMAEQGDKQRRNEEHAFDPKNVADVKSNGFDVHASSLMKMSRSSAMVWSAVVTMMTVSPLWISSLPEGMMTLRARMMLAIRMSGLSRSLCSGMPI